MSRFCYFCLFIFFTTALSAEIVGFPFESEEQEQLFRDLSTELRCLVCQNQSLADSKAGLAQDLRSELYQQVINGNSRKQIITFMTDRYGDFILYKPRFAAKTVLLWITPFLMFAIAVICLFRFSRKHDPEQVVQPAEADLKEIREMLESEVQKK